ncbi:MAG TPA: hypothetical protein VMY88_11740 [Acidimicrobiales bacterium]|nr:hypothetical protein [Acidimicrobiales bacterium]
MTERMVDESLVRDTLRAVAAATPVSEHTPSATRPGRRPRPPRRAALAVAACVVVVAGLAAVAASRGEGGDQHVQVTSPASPAVPSGYDVATATPVFSADGMPDEVAEAYLRARFPDHPAPDIRREPARVDGERATVNWSTGDDEAHRIAKGELVLRRTANRWAVITSTTGEVDVSGLTYDGTRVRGVVRSTSDNSLFADVLDWKGDPVRGAPRPEGQPGAAYRYGTAAGPAKQSLEIDVPAPSQPAVVRVYLVGGTILSVSELRFEPPPLAAHADTDGCMHANVTEKKDPTDDVVLRRCLAALRGTIVASGTVADRAWELVSSEEPAGHWMSLRARDLVGTYRLQPGSGLRGTDAKTSPFLELGACCAAGDSIIVVGAVHPDVRTVRFALRDGNLDIATRQAEGLSYAVAVMPQKVQAEGDVAVSVQYADGTWSGTVTRLSLAVLGG